MPDTDTRYGYRIRIPGKDTGYRIPDTDTGHGFRIRIPDSLKYLFLTLKLLVIVFLVVFFLISKTFDLIFDNSTPEFYRTINPSSSACIQIHFVAL